MEADLTNTFKDNDKQVLRGNEREGKRETEREEEFVKILSQVRYLLS